jgi:ATP-dependent Lon protease
MEPTTLSGYLAEERVAIAERHLGPRHAKKAGLRRAQFKLPRASLRLLIERYARDVKPLPAAVTRGLTIHYVSRFEEVAKLVFPSRCWGGFLARRGRHHGGMGTMA